MKKMKIATAFIFLMTLSSCATIGSLTTEPEDTGNVVIFSGTRTDLGSAWTFMHMGIIDWPFSLVADVVVLPYTIPKSIYNLAVDRAHEHEIKKYQ